MKYNPSPSFIATVIILAAFFAACVWLFGAIIFWQSATAAEEPEVTQSVTLTLPQQCAEFYNDGTEAWINCMGVGYK